MAIDLDALNETAAERAAFLGQPHVTDGPQPYHADALVHDHVPGNVGVDAPAPIPQLPPSVAMMPTAPAPIPEPEVPTEPLPEAQSNPEPEGEQSHG
jgi:hypothetical protein